jgi:uncharacterized protein YbbK (DUF523 family)
MTDKILISACLTGNKVRYDGGDLKQDSQLLENWQRQGMLISLCPEVSGGLPTPRAAAEINQGKGEDVIKGKARVINCLQQDVTDEFIAGAQFALQLCLRHKIKLAILTESSPSCGSNLIYDGSFTRNKTKGRGVTAALLSSKGIKVFNQFQLTEAALWLKSNLDSGKTIGSEAPFTNHHSFQ